MESRFVLPFTLDVEMRMYQDKAFPLGVIKANLEHYETWLCGKLFDCVYLHSGIFDITDEDLWSVNDGLTFVENIYVAPETLSRRGVDLIELNKSMLETGHYITGTYNEYYIPQKDAYLQFDFNHDYVIFGYDDTNEVFKSAAYLQNRSYGYMDISYKDYLQAVTMNKISKTNVDYFLINTKYVPGIDISTIIYKLEGYIHSKKGDRAGVDLFGINVWHELASYVLSVERNIDLRYGRAYMEYHGLMQKRIQVLSKLGYISDVTLESKYHEVYMASVRVHNLFIKYSLTQRNDLLIKISQLIDDTLDKERILIELLIDDLTRKKRCCRMDESR